MFGETLARSVAARIAASVTAVSDLQAIDSDNRQDGMICTLSDGSNWQFSASSTASDSTNNLVVTPSSGSGRWLRTDKVVDLKLAIGYATADAAVLFTVPTGFRLRPTRPLFEVTTPFTGGSSSAIGLSSSNTAYSTKGDLLGGAGGDVAATLIATSPGPFVGTIGAKIAGGVVLVATNTIRFDRITSAFTAGAGFVHVPCEVMAA